MNIRFLVPAIAIPMVTSILGGLAMTSTPAHAGVRPELEMKPDVLLIEHDGLSLPVSLKCPRFTVDSETVGGGKPSSVTGSPTSGGVVEVAYAPVALSGSGQFEAKLHLEWAAKEGVLRKWASYRLVGADGTKVVKEIVLESLDASAKCTQVINVVPQSYPLFTGGFFVGVEFPVASTRVEGGTGIVAHRPGVRMQPGTWYESRKAVYGVAAKGGERAGFERYIMGHYPHPKHLHIDYNSWWTTGIPYSEQDILDLMKVFKEKLSDPYGVSLDTFCIDMGWSDPHSIWGISKTLFPTEFNKVGDAAKAMKSHLGLWLSPISAYQPALDNNWAKAQGYKTFPAMYGTEPYCLICATDERYRSALESQLSKVVREYGVRQIKFDNYRLECPESDHGHEPGALAGEPLADAIISIIAGIRKASPDVWIESNGFGAFQSPWWLFHVSTLLSDLGADAPYGNVPCPIYRESYTTTRDAHNLNGDHLNTVPEADLHVCGFVHQTPEPFMNDLVMTIMRGCMFLPLYINPDYMDDARWQSLARTLKWARKNEKALSNTEPIYQVSSLGPDGPKPNTVAPLSREPYGYAHWDGKRALVAIRNPWIAPCTYRLDLAQIPGLPKDALNLRAEGIYPEVRTYGNNLKPTDTVALDLAPYETVVLSIAEDESGPVNRVAKARYTTVNSRKSELSRAEFEGSAQPDASDRTNLVPEVKSALQVKLDADVLVGSPKAELLVLIEDKTIPVIDPICAIKVNGKDAAVTVSGADTGWAASDSRADNREEQWLFLRAPLKEGRNQVHVDLLNRSETARVSAWVWGYRDGKSVRSGDPELLPEPEIVSMDAVDLLPETSLNTPGLETAKLARPIETIDGVYVDALEPAAKEGALQKNLSITQKPLTLFGRRYYRGLGTTAPAKIEVALDTQYKRFQSWVGEDANTELWDDSIVSFKVVLDGKEIWASKPLVRNNPPAWVDVDVTGGKTLELVSIRSGNHKTAARENNHIDWAEARLLNR